MPRSATVAVPRRLSYELEDALPRTAPVQAPSSPTGPREYDSWPCDSFFLLPDAVLEMDAGAFRADLSALDPVLSASLPEWIVEDPGYNDSLSLYMTSSSPGNPHLRARASSRDQNRPERRSFTLLDNHEGLTVRSFGKGTVLIGGGGDGSGGSSTNAGGSSYIPSSSSGVAAPSATNGPCDPSPQHNTHRATTPTSTTKQDPTQKDRSSGLCYKDREERVRQLRERQQSERQQKLEELKEQAAAAQRFREQQEAARRQRLDDMRSKDFERRNQVEERKRIIQQAEQERRESVLRKSVEREQRLEHKRRQERSNAVFAFGSSTPRMLDPKENITIQNYWGARRATSTTNVNLSDSGSSIRRSSECQETDLSRKRATSAHSLNRKPDDDPMTHSLVTTPSTAARRRTDLMPTVSSLRDTTSTRGSPRHKSPGMAHSLTRLDQLSRPRQQRPLSLAPLHESPKSAKSMTPARTISKSMSHLGPQRARTPIGPATDGVGVPVVDGSLDRRSSRSSLALAHPRMTRAEMLRLKLRGVTRSTDGFRSGTGTPNSPSRPTSALSQASGGSQVILRNRTSPKKPRPLSIAGSTPSSADKPRDPPSAAPASPNRESRSIERKSSVTSNGVTTKPARAKSASSDRSAPSTPAKSSSRGTTPKRTPAQVKAESAARKAAEKSKATSKLRSTPKTTPLQSPSVESKSLPSSEKKTSTKLSTKDIAKPPSKESSSTDLKDETPISSEITDVSQEEPVKAESIEISPSTIIKDETLSQLITDASISQDLLEIVDVMQTSETTVITEVKHESSSVEIIESTIATLATTVEQDLPRVETMESEFKEEPMPESLEKTITAEEEEEEKTLVQRALEKPVTGYATEEEYKAALAEKRRKAREAKERELELERQRQLEEEEKERREEEEYLRLMEDQQKVEEERLKKAIEEAEKQRVEESKRKEEEEKQRIETERIELEKRREAEEKARKEEEERLMRKSRVAQIMSRTRGSKGGNSTPTKAELKTPSEDNKNLNDSLGASSMTESFISTISSSMTDSMIVQAIESRETSQEKSPLSQTEGVIVDTASDCSSQPLSDFSSQPLSDISSQTASSVDLSYSQPSSGIHSESSSIQSSIQITQEEALVITPENNTQESAPVTEPQSSPVELHGSFVSPVTLENTFHLNGNSITMETTPTIHNVDLLGSFNGVNGINYNGVDQQSRPDNDFGSLDPLNSQSSVSFSGKVDTNFDQIIDLNQTKLSNEDAVNSNNPPPPFIAFEDNLNKKQSQESSNVPDLLL